MTPPRRRPLLARSFVAPSLLLAALALSGCSSLGLDQPRWPWEGEARTAARAAPPAADQPYARPKMVEPPPPRPQLQAKVRPAQPTPERPAERPAPAEKGPPPKLVGLSETETAELLGRPADEAEQPPGKVWTYRTNGCELAVHLFPDMERGGFYTLDYTAGEAPKDWCLARIAGEARKQRG